MQRSGLALVALVALLGCRFLGHQPEASADAGGTPDLAPAAPPAAPAVAAPTAVATAQPGAPAPVAPGVPATTAHASATAAPSASGAPTATSTAAAPALPAPPSAACLSKCNGILQACMIAPSVGDGGVPKLPDPTKCKAAFDACAAACK